MITEVFEMSRNGHRHGDVESRPSVVELSASELRPSEFVARCTHAVVPGGLYSRCEAQADDRQFLAPRNVGHDELQLGFQSPATDAIVVTEFHARAGFPTLHAPCFSREDVGGDIAGEGHVRAGRGIPANVGAEGECHAVRAERDEYLVEKLVFEGFEEPFNDGNAAVFAEGAEARVTTVGGAPRAIDGLEMGPLVRDNVPRCAPGRGDGHIEHGTDLVCGGGESEMGAREGCAGEMVEHGDDVPAARPAGWERRGAQGSQKPRPLGTTVRSMCQRWFG